MLRDHKLSTDFPFSGLVRDISEYFKLLKNMGAQYTDISLKSEKIIENWNSPDMPVSDVPVSREDKIAGIEHQLNEKLSFLSLHGEGDVCAKLFFIICDKNAVNTKSRTESKNTGIPEGRNKNNIKYITKSRNENFTGYHQKRGQGREIYTGDAGELFEKILKAMHLSRKNVYTSCFFIPDSLQNKQKISEEVGLCVNLIKKQIDIIHPEVICCLGDTAVRAFLKQNNSISVVRGRFHDYKGIKVMATFDPGRLLAEPEKKRDVWDDMQKIMAVLGI